MAVGFGIDGMERLRITFLGTRERWSPHCIGQLLYAFVLYALCSNFFQYNAIVKKLFAFRPTNSPL